MYYKIRSIESIIAEVKKENIGKTLYKEFYQAVMKVLPRFEGKKFSRRILTAMKEDSYMSKFHLTYEEIAGMTRIGFWGNGLDYDERNSIFLGYHSNPFVDMEKIKEWNKGFENIQLIDESTVGEKVEQWNKIISELNDFIEMNDDISYLLRN